MIYVYPYDYIDYEIYTNINIVYTRQFQSLENLTVIPMKYEFLLNIVYIHVKASNEQYKHVYNEYLK